VTLIALAVGLGALALVAPAAPPPVYAGATTVFVKLTDSKLTVAPSRVPVGTVVFRIVNKGKTARSFAIDGKRARTIAAGKSATLRVELRGRGPRALVSVGRRHGARLNGVLDIFEPCTNPATTTVSVQMAQEPGGITLSQTTIPCGVVTFVVTDVGTMVDSFQVFADYPQAQGSTRELRPGQTARLTVRFTEKGIGYYQSGDYPPGEPEFGGGDNEGGQLAIV
jgi:uncharacterized cupredoxin-like copper-binding protein